MNIVAISDRIVVDPIEEPDQIGSIHLPDKAKHRPQTGYVLSVGPGKIDDRDGTRIPSGVKVGDKIVFHRHDARVFKIAGRDVLILETSKSVLAIDK